MNKEYAGITGVPEFPSAAAKLAYGNDSPVLDRIAVTQTISGTGALRVGAEFLHRWYSGEKKIRIPTPSWANHKAVFQDSRLKVESYRYYNKDTIGLDFEGMIEDLKEAPPGSAFLFHACATLSGGSKGVLHGVRTYVLQNEHGQIQDTHSVSAGLDYPGVGPELSSWKDNERARYIAATDAQAFIGFRLMSQLEGIIPALETAHGIYGAIELAKTMKKGEDVVICVSGRGDKDVQSVADELPKLGPQIGWDLRF